MSASCELDHLRQLIRPIRIINYREENINDSPYQSYFCKTDFCFNLVTVQINQRGSTTGVAKIHQISNQVEE